MSWTHPSQRVSRGKIQSTEIILNREIKERQDILNQRESSSACREKSKMLIPEKI